MAINQGLIQAAGKMQGTLRNTGEGIVKGIQAVGRYVAAKQKIFQAATAGYNAVEEDIPVEQLAEYKTKVDELKKTLKNVPAFMPKYKQAVEEYNGIMKQVTDFKAQSSALAQSKIGIAENAKDLSKYQSNQVNFEYHTDVVTENYVAFMDPRGPMMRFDDGHEILIEDYLQIKPEFISESKDLMTAADSLIETHGTLDKINNVNRAAGSIAQDVSAHAEEVFTTGNHATNIAFNKKFITATGKKTFIEWLINDNPEGSQLYNEILDRITRDENASDEPRSATQTVTLTTEDVVQGAGISMQREVWQQYPGGLEAIEEKYSDFLMQNIKHQQEINSVRNADGGGGNKTGNPTYWDLEEEYKMFPGIASQGRGYPDYADYDEESKRYGVVNLYPSVTTGKKIQNQYDDIMTKVNPGDQFTDFLSNKFTVVGSGENMTYKVTSPGGTTRIVIDPQTDKPITQRRLLETLIDPSILRLIPGHLNQ